MASQTVGISSIRIIFGSCWFLRSDSNYSYLQIEANSFEKFDILRIKKKKNEFTSISNLHLECTFECPYREFVGTKRYFYRKLCPQFPHFNDNVNDAILFTRFFFFTI